MFVESQVRITKNYDCQQQELNNKLKYDKTPSFSVYPSFPRTTRH